MTEATLTPKQVQDRRLERYRANEKYTKTFVRFDRIVAYLIKQGWAEPEAKDVHFDGDFTLVSPDAHSKITFDTLMQELKARISPNKFIYISERSKYQYYPLATIEQLEKRLKRRAKKVAAEADKRKAQVEKDLQASVEMDELIEFHSQVLSPHLSHWKIEKVRYGPDHYSAKLIGPKHEFTMRVVKSDNGEKTLTVPVEMNAGVGYGKGRSINVNILDFLHHYFAIYQKLVDIADSEAKRRDEKRAELES